MFIGHKGNINIDIAQIFILVDPKKTLKKKCKLKNSLLLLYIGYTVPTVTSRHKTTGNNVQQDYERFVDYMDYLSIH